jgi:hypothetical protein
MKRLACNAIGIVAIVSALGMIKIKLSAIRHQLSGRMSSPDRVS